MKQRRSEERLKRQVEQARGFVFWLLWRLRLGFSIKVYFCVYQYMVKKHCRYLRIAWLKNKDAFKTYLIYFRSCTSLITKRLEVKKRRRKMIGRRRKSPKKKVMFLIGETKTKTKQIQTASSMMMMMMKCWNRHSLFLVLPADLWYFIVVILIRLLLYLCR